MVRSLFNNALTASMLSLLIFAPCDRMCAADKPVKPAAPSTFEYLKDLGMQQLGKAISLAANVLSGNKTALLSGNQAALLSGNKAAMLSGNCPKVLSDNATPILSGNTMSLFSNISVKIEIHIDNSVNNHHAQAEAEIQPAGERMKPKPKGPVYPSPKP